MTCVEFFLIRSMEMCPRFSALFYVGIDLVTDRKSENIPQKCFPEWQKLIVDYSAYAVAVKRLC